MTRGRRLLGSLLLVLGSAPTAPATAAARPSSEPTRAAAVPAPADLPADLPARYREWLEEVAPLITPAERRLFLSLTKDYQRQAFERAFWDARDPYPQTPRNELREAWQEHVELARARYSDLADDRARMLLLNGPPDRTFASICGALLRPLEVWEISHSPLVHGSFVLVFFQPAGQRQGRYRLWHPSQGFASLFLLGAGGDEQLAQQVRDECMRADDLLAAITAAADWDQLESRGARIPTPSDEWLKNFAARSTEMPDAAALLPAHLELAFPGRHQSRTVVQGLVRVPATAAVAAGVGEASVYRFLVDGEVLRNDQLFESFRYRFDVPASGIPAEIPLLLERYLRPGDYHLVVRVEDLNGSRFFRQEQDLVVPLVATGAAVAAAPGAAAPAAAPATAGDDVVVKLSPPPPDLLTGRLRVEADVHGDRVARVRFLLDGKPVLAKATPPYSVELELGGEPRLHQLVALAEASDGSELARDEVPINAGPHRFAVRLVDPKPGTARAGLPIRAEAAVEVPAGERLERVEMFVDETLLATLYQPPFVQTLVPPAGRTVSYVRAVAHLASGAVAEDLAFLTAPKERQAVDVDLVELYTTALDRRGRPVTDLTASDFTVKEDGKLQQLVRCDWVQDVPLHAVVMIDTSSSMQESIDQAEATAQRFFDQLMTPHDRAAVVTFADKTTLQVPFTSDPAVLRGGLAHIVVEGETVLYDSLVYSLWYLSGIRGKRVLVVLTDGEDTKSHHRFEEVIEYARRSGVTVYAIGIGLSASGNNVARMALSRLAAETGGSSFFLDRRDSLDPIYRTIERELRSQYLLAYQSNGSGSGYRKVAVAVRRPGVSANAAKGYYP